MAKVSHGTFLYKSAVDSSPVTYTKIGELTDIDGPGWTREIVDATSHDDTVRSILIHPVKVPGNVTFSGRYNLTDAGQVLLLTHILAETLAYWYIALPGSQGSKYFTGYLIDFKLGPHGTGNAPQTFSGAIALATLATAAP